MMPVSIVHQTSSDNKGSCSKYGHYLNKENKELKKEGKGARQQYFFSQNRNMVTTVKAISMVDENNKNKGLAKKQDKYFTLTLNFSQSEQEHLASTIAKRPIENVDELSVQEYQHYNEVIKLFARQAMRNYAANFKKNIDEKKIVWFAKIEHKRKYKGTDKEVIIGRVKSGEPKKGMQSHVHITVSRMHKDYRINLSPLTNARSSVNLVLNGKKVQGGFDRSNWKQLNEDSFDKMFEYKRGIEEKFETLRKLKHGTLEEKLLLKAEIREEKEKNPKLQKLDNIKEEYVYFNQDLNTVTKAKAISMVDNNDMRKEAPSFQDYYVSLTLTLSPKEQEHLASTVANRPIEKLEELTAIEYEQYNEAIKLFTQQVVHNYIAHVKKNIDKRQLKWFAQIEHKQYSKDDDEKDNIGKVKNGEFKKGLQIKIHMAVLKPQKGHHIENDSLQNTGISKKPMLDDKKEIDGIDLSYWKQLNENLFDKMFGYLRSPDEKGQTLKMLKPGLLMEKLALKAKILLEKEKNKGRQKNQPPQQGSEIGKIPNKGRSNQISL